ncbi:protein kinase [Streptomyces sp. NPDC051907]|uniref:protein kinase n=1 Tax=Streptomyces sp. NPDC051907 TaxID=3155284 RepID=UPI0034121F7F
MDDYAGRVLADRYRLPLPPSDEFELVETRAFDTYSGQEVLVRQVPLPEVVDAEVVDADGLAGAAVPRRSPGRTTRRPADPAVLRAVEAAQAAAQIPDHPRLDQVFDVFAEGGSLWIVSERVAARPLAALLADKPLSPYRAAEVASDVLTALRVLHAHGWTHRNITTRTVLVCDDGRVVLTGLASGAAEEALCGYAPVPESLDGDEDAPGESAPGQAAFDPSDPSDPAGPSDPADPNDYGDPLDHGDPSATGPEHLGQQALGQGESGYSERGADEPGDGGSGGSSGPGSSGGPGRQIGAVPDVRAARAGAIAAYRAGARAAARVNEDLRRGDGSGAPGTGPVQSGLDPDWWAQRPGEAHPVVDVDDDDDDDEYGEGFAGTARLAGTWHDSPFPGREGSGPIPAGGNTDPYGGELPYGYRRATPEVEAPPTRPALPAPRSASDRPSSTPGPAPGSAPSSASSSRPASTGSWQHGLGGEALRADSQRNVDSFRAGARQPAGAQPSAQHSALPAVAEAVAPTGRWDELLDDGAPAFRGPSTPLAAERARQARIAVVGAVTERWAPEQAGPVHENWQLAAPVGPSTDLWALGALLYRAVQGHAPYPEENAAELVQLVCAEPPAFAEECGPLRPVVESLLRQDPTERPDFEELRGWLRSLIRSAPEPEAGMDVVALPSTPVDPARLPVIRRRGELVRRRRGGADVAHGRHRHKKAKGGRDRRAGDERTAAQPTARRSTPRGSTQRAPRALGRTLLILILLAMAAAVAYAVLFMPKSDSQEPSTPRGSGQNQPQSGPGNGGEPTGDPAPDRTASASPDKQKPSEQQPQTSAPARNLPYGYALRTDPEGFQIAVDKSWQRSPINDAGQVRYADGDFTLIVVPGRDSVKANGDDPLAYQRDKERELQPFRDSSWAGATGLRRIEVGQQVMAEGQFTWQDASGREVYVRNFALIVGGSYHVVQVIGPEGERDRVTEVYEQATTTYRTTR